MKLVDANVLVHAANADAREHPSARKWIEAAFLEYRANRIRVDRAARLYSRFYSTRSASQASQNCRRVRVVEDWLRADNAVVVHPGENHAAILRSLLEPVGTAGNLTSDAHLAALAIEHGAELVSFDRDFNRFERLRTVILKA